MQCSSGRRAGQGTVKVIIIIGAVKHCKGGKRWGGQRAIDAITIISSYDHKKWRRGCLYFYLSPFVISLIPLLERAIVSLSAMTAHHMKPPSTPGTPLCHEAIHSDDDDVWWMDNWRKLLTKGNPINLNNSQFINMRSSISLKPNHDPHLHLPSSHSWRLLLLRPPHR